MRTVLNPLHGISEDNTVPRLYPDVPEEASRYHPTEERLSVFKLEESLVGRNL